MRKIIYWKVCDKQNWARGEWDEEPDKMQWKDHKTGLPCMIVRHKTSGHLCGYVGVAKGHPFFEKGYDECYLTGDDLYIDVHGGLTFADKCQVGRDPCESVCHEVEVGEDDDIWWLGFDCAHSGDYTGMAYPDKIRRDWPCDDDTYRNIGYVKSECLSLARQLKSVV